MSRRPVVTRPPAEALHPQVQAFLDEASQQDWASLHSLTPAQARAQVDLEVEAMVPARASRACVR